MVSTEWSQTTKRFVIVGLVLAFLVALYLFRAIIPLVAIAMVLAYVLKPLADVVERRTGVPRVLAVGLVFVALLLIIATIPATIVPYAVDRIARLNLQLQRLVDDIATFLSRPIMFLDVTFNPEDLVGDVEGALQGLLRTFASQTPNLLFGVASGLVWILSILIISFYLILDAQKLRGQLDRLAPPEHAHELGQLREEISGVWSAFFRGQVALSLIVGMLVWITMTAIGLPNAGLIAVLAGILEVIPTFGPVVASLAAIVTAFLRGSTYLPLSNFWFAVLVLLVYLVIHQIDNAYLVPRIMGRRLRLHPVVVFVGVLAGGMLAGVVGVFLAAPVIATTRVLLSYTYAKLLDQQPFPPEPEVAELYPGEIDAILFDLDGTLADTDDEVVDALTRRLRHLRWFLPGRDPCRSARRLLMATERPTARLLGILDRVGLDDDLLDLGDRLRRLRGVSAPLNFRAVDGVVGMLHELDRRYHLAIVTTRNKRVAEAFVSQHGLGDLVQVITGRDDTWRIKPHPSPVRHTAEKLGVPVESCLIVGDTTADIEAARAAGARSVGVLCGFGSRDQLERAGADLILATTHDLVDWL
jgi:predicted PurR-regulated permease PerM/phosphoglycolate phosphatase-like HAD superfamily hydrolase